MSRFTPLLTSLIFIYFLCLSISASYAEETDESTVHLVIFSPSAYAHLENASEFVNGTMFLREQCRLSGVANRRIVVLHAGERNPNRRGTLANFRRELERLRKTTQENDQILLAVLSYGIHVDGKDYISCQDTTREGFLQGKTDELIAVEEIVETLGQSGAGHKLILVDTATLQEPVQGSVRIDNDEFGTGLITPSANQVVLLNRRREIYRPDDKTLTCSLFLRHFLNSISTEARTVETDKRVTMVQTIDSMQRYLESSGDTTLWLSGSFEKDAVLLPNRREAFGLKPIPVEVWKESVENELELAAKSILLYHRPKDALALLRKTGADLKALEGRDNAFHSQADQANILRFMAMGMSGEATVAWKEAQESGLPMYLYVVQSSPIQGKVIRVSGFQGNGTVLYDREFGILMQSEKEEIGMTMTFSSEQETASGRLDLRTTVLGNTSPIGAHLEKTFLPGQ